jgi:hypothetical protein
MGPANLPVFDKVDMDCRFAGNLDTITTQFSVALVSVSVTDEKPRPW